MKLLANPDETEEMVTDDSHHPFPRAHRVVVGNYLELTYQTTKVMPMSIFLTIKEKPLYPNFSVVANCTQPEIVTKKRRGKEQEIYLITHSMQCGLYEIVNYSDVNHS